ncbi:MAG: hypothetical protein ACI88A_005064 [Paraglaciecola sp.]
MGVNFSIQKFNKGAWNFGFVIWENMKPHQNLDELAILETINEWAEIHKPLSNTSKFTAVVERQVYIVYNSVLFIYFRSCK